ncbi:LysR family transcriptional regulator [Corynebacterium sp. 335C]
MTSLSASSRMPDLDALDLLVAVADHGGIGAAARAVGLAQPNASRALGRLERSLGVVLLDRGPGGARPTAAGLAVIGHARRVLAAADDLVASAGEWRDDAGVIRVSASMTVAEHHLPAWTAHLHREHPGAVPHVRVANSADVVADVAAGRAHLGFVESPGGTAGLRSRDVARDHLCLVVHPSHPWARRGAGDPVGAAELASTPLVVREAGSGTREALDAALAAAVGAGAGVQRAEPAMEQGSAAAVVMSVIAGVAPAVAPVEAVRAHVAAGRLVEVPVAGIDLHRTLRAVWSGARTPPGAAGTLLRIASRGGAADGGAPTQAPADADTGGRGDADDT